MKGRRDFDGCGALGALSIALGWLGCADARPEEGGDGPVDGRQGAVTVPAKGADHTFDVASWNLEFFGDTGNGPTNETLQESNAGDVIRGADMDVWGLAEIVSTSRFNSLKAKLPGYAGFLANDPGVVNGAAFYGSGEQKVGILFKSALATVTDARVVLTSQDFNFAGRPPLQVTLRVTLNGVAEDVVVIVMHAKCCSDGSSFDRRLAASGALKSYLDSTFATRKVWVVGDFNDDLDASISPGKPSPYANFVNDTADYAFATRALTDEGESSTVGFSDMIDHHLVTNESRALLLGGSAEVYRVDQFIANYGGTTSDHFPVLSRYAWGGGGGGGGAARVVINEIGANEPGSGTAGEFVEIVNVGGAAADLGGFTLADGGGVRHAFPAGASLAAGKAVVVFGGAPGVPGGVPNAVVASSGGLSLANGGDSVTLRDGAGVVVDSFAYSSSLADEDGVSMNRSPDAGAGAPFVKHDAVSSLASSPGGRADGAPF